MNLFLFLLTFTVIFVSIETQFSSEENNSLEEENDSTLTGSPITGPPPSPSSSPPSPPSPPPSPQSRPLSSPQRRRRIFGPNISLISLESKEVSSDSNQKFGKRIDSRAQLMAKWETEVKDIEIEESIRTGEKKARIRSFDSKGSLSADIKSNSDLQLFNQNLIKGQKTKGIIESILKRNKREINETEVNKQQNNNNFEPQNNTNSEQQNQNKENKGFFEEAKETIEKGAKKVGEFFDKAGKAIKGVADKVFGK